MCTLCSFISLKKYQCNFFCTRNIKDSYIGKNKRKYICFIALLKYSFSENEKNGCTLSNALLEYKNHESVKMYRCKYLCKSLFSIK